jgi:hypothetical protein
VAHADRGAAQIRVLRSRGVVQPTVIKKVLGSVVVRVPGARESKSKSKSKSKSNSSSSSSSKPRLALHALPNGPNSAAVVTATRPLAQVR